MVSARSPAKSAHLLYHVLFEGIFFFYSTVFVVKPNRLNVLVCTRNIPGEAAQFAHVSQDKQGNARARNMKRHEAS